MEVKLAQNDNVLYVQQIQKNSHYLTKIYANKGPKHFANKCKSLHYILHTLATCKNTYN
uniref:Uncharacterized protein n=1 Tax=Arundo donax TaxID=35708 RepID=A0A0A9D948_ARUDO